MQEMSAVDVSWRLCIVAKRQHRSMVNVCNWRRLILQTELTRTFTVMAPGKRFFEVLCALKHDSPVCSWWQMTLRELWHSITIKICAVALMHLSPNWFNVVVGAVKCHAVCVKLVRCGFVCSWKIYLQNKFWWFMAYKLILPPGWAVAQPIRMSVLCKMLKIECVWCAKRAFYPRKFGDKSREDLSLSAVTDDSEKLSQRQL